MELLPIETAPKDGTNIIIYTNHLTVGHYDTEYNKWVIELYDFFDEDCVVNPTHWMPR